MRPSILDLISLAKWHDTCVVFPTLGHAFEDWRIIRTAFAETYDVEHVAMTKTAIVPRMFTRHPNRVLRLWVPYEPSPEMPMDLPIDRRPYDLVSSYYTRRELLRWR